MFFQSIITLDFFSSSQWEKLQKDDTDPGQLKGIKGSVETVARDTSSVITHNQDTKVHTKRALVSNVIKDSTNYRYLFFAVSQYLSSPNQGPNMVPGH